MNHLAPFYNFAIYNCLIIFVSGYRQFSGTVEALLYCAVRLVYICFGVGKVPDLPTLFEVFLLVPLLFVFLALWFSFLNVS